MCNNENNCDYNDNYDDCNDDGDGDDGGGTCDDDDNGNCVYSLLYLPMCRVHVAVVWLTQSYMCPCLTWFLASIESTTVVSHLARSDTPNITWVVTPWVLSPIRPNNHRPLHVHRMHIHIFNKLAVA